MKLRLPAPLRRQLKRKRRLTLRLIARVHDPAGNTRTVRRRAVLRPANQPSPTRRNNT